MLTSLLAGMHSMRCKRLKKWLRIRENKEKPPFSGRFILVPVAGLELLQHMLKHVEITRFFEIR